MIYRKRGRIRGWCGLDWAWPTTKLDLSNIVNRGG